MPGLSSWDAAAQGWPPDRDWLLEQVAAHHRHVQSLRRDGSGPADYVDAMSDTDLRDYMATASWFVKLLADELGPEDAHVIEQYDLMWATWLRNTSRGDLARPETPSTS